jgi:hypothetical protein
MDFSAQAVQEGHVGASAATCRGCPEEVAGGVPEYVFPSTEGGKMNKCSY